MAQRTYILRKGVSRLEDLADGGQINGYPGDYPGKIYYVNNVTGGTVESGRTGLSWDDCFSQISDAIAASAAFHAAAANQTHIRNIIYVQGTGTGYNALTALDSYVDIVGVGASPYGNGAGIPLIGNAAGGNSTPITTSATVRGCNFFNMQFAFGSGSTSGVRLNGAFLRGKFINCSFLNSGTNSTGACLYVNNSFAGNLIQHCQFSGDAGYPAYGIYFADSITMNNNIVEDNIIIAGTTAGIYLGSGVNDVNTIFRNNLIGAPQANNSAKGFDDNGPGNSFSYNNYIIGSDAIEETISGHFLGNYTMDGTTAGFEEDISNF